MVWSVCGLLCWLLRCLLFLRKLIRDFCMCVCACFLGCVVLLCCVGFFGCVDVPMVGMGSDWAAGHLSSCSPF